MCTLHLALQVPRPRGPKARVVGCAGGPGVVALPLIRLGPLARGSVWVASARWSLTPTRCACGCALSVSQNKNLFTVRVLLRTVRPYSTAVHYCLPLALLSFTTRFLTSRVTTADRVNSDRRRTSLVRRGTLGEAPRPENARQPLFRYHSPQERGRSSPSSPLIPHTPGRSSQPPSESDALAALPTESSPSSRRPSRASDAGGAALEASAAAAAAASSRRTLRLRALSR
jgi:hypothetical protein